MIAEGCDADAGATSEKHGSMVGLAPLLEADADAEYAAVIEIDLADIDQPIVCAPNDPDDAALSDV